MEMTRAELEELRERADAAGNEKLFQYLCGQIDQIDHEEEQ